MLEKVGLYYRTLKHLKPIQFRYRVWYILRKKVRELTGYSYALSISKEGHKLGFRTGIQKVTFNIKYPASGIQHPASSSTWYRAAEIQKIHLS